MSGQGPQLAIPSDRQPIAVIGRTGQLGSAMGVTLPVVAASVPFAWLGRDMVDLAKPETIRALAGRGYRTIINCAAWTDVDGAEANEEGANAVNADAIGELATVCRREGSLLVNYSTDYVFDGNGTRPYAVDHPRSPVNAYGRSKARGEEILEQSGCEYLLIRTSWVYAPHGKNFVRTIHAAAKTRPGLKVVNDQRGRPTSASNLTDATLRLIEKGARGTFHVTDSGECTWYEFAKEIVRLARLSTPVEPCTSADFPRPAKRPAYSVLDINTPERRIGPLPDWKVALDSVMFRMPS
jgi:dTDP-4-dehydrorhamnose reductase